MWRHRFRAETDLSPSILWEVLSDLANWPQIDPQVESVELDGQPAAGTQFRLKPRNAPQLNLVIERFEPPHVYADVCRMPLTQMRTTHALNPTDQGTQIEVTIEIFGAFWPLWVFLVGRKHARGLREQTERFVQRAKELSPTDARAFERSEESGQ